MYSVTLFLQTTSPSKDLIFILTNIEWRMDVKYKVMFVITQSVEIKVITGIWQSLFFYINQKFNLEIKTWKKKTFFHTLRLQSDLEWHLYFEKVFQSHHQSYDIKLKHLMHIMTKWSFIFTSKKKDRMRNQFKT